MIDDKDPPSLDSVVEELQEETTVGEAYKEWSVEKQEKRRSNLEWSTKKLRDLGVNFSSFNMGVHLKIDHDGFNVDFWPSTGKFIFRMAKSPINGVHRNGRGIKKLLRGMGLKK